MNRDYCIKCRVKLSPAAIKNHTRTCRLCISKKRVATLQSDEYIDETFTYAWSKELYRRLITFLDRHEISIWTKSRMFPKVILLFQAAQNLFDSPEAISQEWVEMQIAAWGDKRNSGVTCFRAFFVEERIFSQPARRGQLISMNRDYCIKCGVKLSPAAIKDHLRTCQLCIS